MSSAVITCVTSHDLQDSFLDEGFILDKKIGVGQPKRITDAKVLIANTPMDTDKIKIYGARVRVDSMAKVGGSRISCWGARRTPAV
jgi:T-complex protein 1 subunit beta